MTLLIETALNVIPICEPVPVDAMDCLVRAPCIVLINLVMAERQARLVGKGLDEFEVPVVFGETGIRLSAYLVTTAQVPVFLPRGASQNAHALLSGVAVFRAADV